MTKTRKRERGNGEGSIFKLSGKRKNPWAIRITVGWCRETGRQKTKYLSYHRTRTEAKAALRDYLVNPYDLSLKDVTIADMYNAWRSSTNVSKSTLAGYNSIFNRIPDLHNRKIREVKIIDLKEAMGAFKPSQQENFKYVIKHIYMTAIEYEAADKDLSIFLKPETPEKKPRKPFTLEQVAKIKEFDHELNDIAIILLYTGMRINELLEMDRENVNLEERYFYGGKKTPTGKTRITPIHNEIYPLVENFYNKGHKRLISFRGKHVSYLSFLTGYWAELRDYLETDHTPHCTRHTFVTFARRSGLDRDLVKKIVGHSKKDVTDIYDHSDIEELLTEINKLSYDL